VTRPADKGCEQHISSMSADPFGVSAVSGPSWSAGILLSVVTVKTGMSGVMAGKVTGIGPLTVVTTLAKVVTT